MKTRRRIVTALLAAAAVSACADSATEVAREPAAAPSTSAAQHARIVPDRYIVLFHDRVQDAPGLSHRLVTAHGGRLHHSYRHAVKGFAATLSPAAAEALRRNPDVALVEPDREATGMYVQNPVASWGLDRLDQADLPLDNRFTFGTTGRGIRVYVIDSGIQTAHPDFDGRATVGADVRGGNGQDCNGHGTHVAGIIGSTTYGVAKEASLVSVRVWACDASGSFGGSASDLVAGIDWVTGNRVLPAVANISGGMGGIDRVAAVDQAVERSIDAGVTYVVAAGNMACYSSSVYCGGSDACNVSPAGVPRALTVAASTRSDTRMTGGAAPSPDGVTRVWVGSNYGPCVDLFAPGQNILSTWPTWRSPSGTFTTSGTSMSAPFVAGYAAVWLQSHRSATPDQVHAAVISLATPGRLGTNIGDGSPNLLLQAVPLYVTSTPFPCGPDCGG